MNEPDDYADWLKARRKQTQGIDLADRIMTAVAVQKPVRRKSVAVRVGPLLLWTAASLMFLIRIVSFVGNLAFPSHSYPEFATDQRIEEPENDRRNSKRS